MKQHRILMTLIILSSFWTSTSYAEATSADSIRNAMPELTIYHLEGRRSERLVWLMEELNLPYNLVFERGSLAGSMAKIKAVNPDMPMAPTVTLGAQVLVESGAIIELLLGRYAPNELHPPIDSDEYASYLMWMHYAEGSLAARLIADYRTWLKEPPTERSRLVDSEATVQFAENYLAKNAWFGGEDFSAADIMMLFPLTLATSLNIVDEAQFPKIALWKEKAVARPAYKRMLEKARPDGMIGMLPKLPSHAPAGPRR
jgi:glutathione S-transferase